MRKKYCYSKDRKQFYRDRAAQQNHRCGLCGEAERLVVDHDHLSGHMRGVLCYRCNAGLGMFQDNPVLLEKAILYLRNFQAVPLPTKKTLQPVKHQIHQDIQKLLADESFSSDRSRAKILAQRYTISWGAANQRIHRFRHRITKSTDHGGLSPNRDRPIKSGVCVGL